MKRNNYNIHESDVIEEMINRETKYWSWSRSTVDANGNFRTLTAEEKRQRLQKYIDYVKYHTYRKKADRILLPICQIRKYTNQPQHCYKYIKSQRDFKRPKIDDAECQKCTRHQAIEKCLDAHAIAQKYNQV